ncbi:MAG: GTP-binding protein, partial [Gemmatimonadaceae bacterium]
RVSKARQAEWRPLIEGYLTASRELRGVVQLLDARHDPTGDDLAMLDFLAELGAPTLVAATKVDKLRASERANRLAALAQVTGIASGQIIPFSAVTGTGRDELAEAIMDLIAQPSWRDA